MSTTLSFPSFSISNIRERSELAAPVGAGDSTITLESTEGYASDDILYLGALNREGCERAVVDHITDARVITLTEPVTLGHPQFDAVTSVLGDRIRIYRALDVDGTVPADDTFSALASRSIDADQVDTHYTDSSGSAAYWYRHSYYNETSLAETDYLLSDPQRGDDYARYANLDEIRREAGFEHATNLSNVDVDMQRRNAQNEVNAALTGLYEVPFTKSIPALVTTVVTKLAAGFLLSNAYSDSSIGKDKVKEARAMLANYKSGVDVFGEAEGVIDLRGDGIDSFPNDDEKTLFSLEDRY